jgi:hypothetical protein
VKLEEENLITSLYDHIKGNLTEGKNEVVPENLERWDIHTLTDVYIRVYVYIRE